MLLDSEKLTWHVPDRLGVVDLQEDDKAKETNNVGAQKDLQLGLPQKIKDTQKV